MSALPIWFMELEEDERRILCAPRIVGPTAMLGLSLACAWNPRTIFMIINVYLDESGTHDTDFMVMAGYAGVLGAWNRFDKKWAKNLRSFGVETFHAKEMQARGSSYRGKPPQDVESFRRRCVFLADSHALFGFSVRLDRKDYLAHYIGDRASNPRKFQPDSMWGLCFRAALKLSIELLETEFKRPGWRVNFIVDEGHKNAGAASVILRQTKDFNISGVSERLGTVTLGACSEFPGLQAADGLAYGCWNIEPHVDTGNVRLSENAPNMTLSEARSKTHASEQIPHLRVHLNAERLVSYKSEIVEYYEFRRTHGQSGPSISGESS